MKNKFDEISWIEIDNKIIGRKISKETIEKIHSWICNIPQVVNSPLTNYYVNIKNNTTVKDNKTENLLIKISIRELSNDLINTPKEVGFSGTRSESAGAIIEDKWLKKYMPPRYKK